jgi:hypothetical protein
MTCPAARPTTYTAKLASCKVNYGRCENATRPGSARDTRLPAVTFCDNFQPYLGGIGNRNGRGFAVGYTSFACLERIRRAVEERGERDHNNQPLFRPAERTEIIKFAYALLCSLVPPSAVADVLQLGLRVKRFTADRYVKKARLRGAPFRRPQGQVEGGVRRVFV